MRMQDTNIKDRFETVTAYEIRVGLGSVELWTCKRGLCSLEAVVFDRHYGGFLCAKHAKQAGWKPTELRQHNLTITWVSGNDILGMNSNQIAQALRTVVLDVVDVDATSFSFEFSSEIGSKIEGRKI